MTNSCCTCDPILATSAAHTTPFLARSNISPHSALPRSYARSSVCDDGINGTGQCSCADAACEHSTSLSVLGVVVASRTDTVTLSSSQRVLLNLALWSYNPWTVFTEVPSEIEQIYVAVAPAKWHSTVVISAWRPGEDSFGPLCDFYLKSSSGAVNTSEAKSTADVTDFIARARSLVKGAPLNANHVPMHFWPLLPMDVFPWPCWHRRRQTLARVPPDSRGWPTCQLQLHPDSSCFSGSEVLLALLHRGETRIVFRLQCEAAAV